MADFTTQTYLTVAEATEYLRFASVNAFRHWVRRHPIPVCRTGRRLLYRRRDLDLAVLPVSARLVTRRGA